MESIHGPRFPDNSLWGPALSDSGVPPFQAVFSRRVDTIRFNHIVRDAVWYRDDDAWRREILEDNQPWLRGGTGSFWAWDGESIGVYNAYEDYFELTTDIALIYEIYEM
ncbi:MAG: hypothetical protein ACE5IJ_11475, partial [Thermoplasmata archaeon]